MDFVQFSISDAYHLACLSEDAISGMYKLIISPKVHWHLGSELLLHAVKLLDWYKWKQSCEATISNENGFQIHVQL